MNDKEYSSMQGIRRSDLWEINRSPLHFKYRITCPPEQTASMRFGSAYHKYILERDSFLDEFYIIPNVNKRTKAGKELLDELERQNKDKTGITEAEYEQIRAMKNMLALDSKTSPYLEAIQNQSAKTEVAFSWIDAKTGEMCKCKADMLIDRENPVIVDFKTCASCETRAFHSDMRKFGYLFQAGFYCEGIDLCTMETHTFTFIAQEKTPPYAPRIFYLEEPEIEVGKEIFHKLLEKYHECRMNDSWSGYEEEYLYVE